MIEFYQKARELPPVPELEPMTRKPKILYVADVPSWTFDGIGRRYKKNLPEFDIDISFANLECCKKTNRVDQYYLNLVDKQVYDAVCLMDVFYIPDYYALRSFIDKMHSRGTVVALSINNYMSDEQVLERLFRFKAFDVMSASTVRMCDKLALHGIKADFIPDSIDRDIFKPTTAWADRDFQVLFVASKIHLEHKGYKIWQETKEILKSRTDIKFKEIVVDSFSHKDNTAIMLEAYNQSKVYTCLSASEGGPHPLLEAAICGCNIISTNVGLADYFKSAFVIPRDAKTCAEKLLYLADNPEVARELAAATLEEGNRFDSRVLNKHWAHFMQKAIRANNKATNSLQLESPGKRELIEFYQHVPSLEPTETKPDVLFVADVSNWAFDLKGRALKKALAEYFNIDIGYANIEHCSNARIPQLFWRNMARQKHYDLILLCHDSFLYEFHTLKAYVQKANKRNTLVTTAANIVYSSASIQDIAAKLRLYNGIATNNLVSYESIKSLGLPVSFTPDGIDREVYASKVPLANRPFQVLFVSSKLHLEHKGYKLWQEVKNKLSARSDIFFREVVNDSFRHKDNVAEVVDAYNSSSVHVCLSKAEGTPRTVLEAISCGCNVISTRVGIAQHLKNILHIERSAEDCANKLVLLKDNVDLALSMNDKVCKEIEDYDIKKIANFWGHFMQKALRSPKLQ